MEDSKTQMLWNDNRQTVMKKQKTQTVMKYQETSFGLPLPTLPLKSKASSHQALSLIF